MAKKQFETRMVLTVPSRGVITIEGSTEFVRKFFDDVRNDFVISLSNALAYDKSMTGRDFEIIETSTPKHTTLSIAENMG